jgi:beta-lactam-binding protein with PASTA domain
MTFINTGTSTNESGRKVGELVEQHIQETRRELKDDKNKLRTEEYKEDK